MTAMMMSQAPCFDQLQLQCQLVKFFVVFVLLLFGVALVVGFGVHQLQ